MEQQEISVEPPADDDERATEVDTMVRTLEDSRVLPSGVSAFDAVDTVLCALEMRLPRADAQDVAAAVPPTLRAVLSRCIVHKTDQPELSLDQLGFLRLVATQLEIELLDAERVTRAVFEAVQQLLPEDEIWDVRNRLPRELDTLWYPFNQTNREPFEPPPPEPEAHGVRPVEEPTETILAEIDASGVLPDGATALAAVEAVLCTLALELTGGELEELATLAPRTLSTLLARCARDRSERPQTLREETFLEHVAEHLGVDVAKAPRITRTVFAAVRGRLPAADVAKIENRLPRSVRRLWAR